MIESCGEGDRRRPRVESDRSDVEALQSWQRRVAVQIDVLNDRPRRTQQRDAKVPSAAGRNNAEVRIVGGNSHRAERRIEQRRNVDRLARYDQVSLNHVSDREEFIPRVVEALT